MFLFDNFRMGGISVDMMLDLVLSTCDLWDVHETHLKKK
jgi:hypothetical protein